MVFLWFSHGFSVEPPSPQTDLRVAAGAAPFNRLCRIYAPRYRQALARWAHSVVCEWLVWENHGKTMGNPWENGDLWMYIWIYLVGALEHEWIVTYCDFPLSIPHPLKVQVNVMCIALMMPPSPFARWKQLEQALVGMRKVTESIVNGMPLMV